MFPFVNIIFEEKLIKYIQNSMKLSIWGKTVHSKVQTNNHKLSIF